MTLSANSSTNYAAPQSITTQSYSETVAYNSWLGITQTTGANGEQLSMTYDSYGRPSTGTSPYGAVTYYGYSTSGTPVWQTKTGPDGFTKTTLDGLGRPVLVERGTASNNLLSATQTVYAPCACSPLAKIQKVSQPYADGGSPSVWTVYAYDGLGRTLTTTQPDGASATTYSYQGNQTTVTDPATRWKTFTTDVLGNLITVVEPDPANQPGGTLTTTYTYDWMNHVSGVSMTRGSTTQTRSFVYSDKGLLTSATNPENGTVTYTYNSDNTLAYKVDAKSQKTAYTYDGKKRVTFVQRYASNGYEDTCQEVTYTYDTNPVNGSFSQYSYGRLTTSQYSMCVNVVGTATFVEMYSYHPAGAVTAKQLQVARGGNRPATMEVDYGYTAAGQQSTVTYPVQGQQVTYTYAYDAMGRPASLTDNSGDIGLNGANIDCVQNVQYDFAGRLASWQHYVATSNNYYGVPVQVSTKEARQYNANGQMSSLTWSYNTAYTPNTWSTPAGIQYVYSTTQNNGQITQAVDSLSGETIVYQYDQLKRLTSASSTPNTGSSPTPWTQTFQYDGFGNLTAKVLNGTTTPIPVSATTNRLSNASYDTNGNMTSGGGATMGYDEANRIVSAAEVSGGVEYYGYAPDNKRIYRLESDGTSEDITFYGAQGEKLGMFYLSCPFNCSVAQRQDVVWFAGKLIWQDWAALSGGTVNQDRLGTNRFTGARYYPYGDEITSTPNDVTKFATYNRDGFTGFDYADQRFYASVYGRFNTVDPYSGSARPRSPRSWNRYSYTFGDPINHSDPSGRDGGDGCDEGSWMTDTGYCEPDFGDTDQNDNSASGVVYESTGTLDSATTTAQACTNGLSYSNVTPSGNGFTGTCDNPLSSTGAAILQLTGQNMGAVNTVIAIAVAPYLIPAGLGAATAATGLLGGPAAGLLAGETPVVGSLANTLPYVGQAGYNALEEAGYDIAVQEAWMAAVVSSGQSVLLATPLPGALGTMFSIEAGFLQHIGYEQIGNFLVPPVP